MWRFNVETYGENMRSTFQSFKISLFLPQIGATAKNNANCGKGMIFLKNVIIILRQSMIFFVLTLTLFLMPNLNL